MDTHRTVLAIFRDADDETSCAPLLAGIPNTIRQVADDNLRHSLEKLRGIGIAPAVTVVSSRLYPEARPEVVGLLRELFPESEFMLVSSTTDSFPPLRPLAADRIRHVALNTVTPRGIPGDTRAQFVKSVLKLVEGSRWEMDDYLLPGTAVHEFAVAASSQKEELIAHLENAIQGETEELDLLRQRAALLADEMLENAMYGAPQGADGNSIYRKGDERIIQAWEKIVFRFGFDGETLAIEIADGWGSLSADLVMEHLARNHEQNAARDEAGGRGLFIIWRFLDHFHVSIVPGKLTVVGGHLKANSPIDPDAPRGFTISTHI